MSHSQAENGTEKNSSSRPRAQTASEQAARDGPPRREDDAATSETFVKPLSQVSPYIYESLPAHTAVPGTEQSSQGNAAAPEGAHAPKPATYDQHESSHQSPPKESLQTLPKADNDPCIPLPQSQPFAITGGWESSSSPANCQREGWRLAPGGIASSAIAASTPSSSSPAILPLPLAKESPPAVSDLQTGSVLSSLEASPQSNRRSSRVSWQLEHVLSTPVSAREAGATHTTRSKDTETRTGSTANAQRATLLAYVAMALTVIGFCVVLTIVLLVTVPPDTLQTVCTSAACIALDALLEQSVDRTKDACTDFYAYVCHGWADSQNVSVYRSHVHSFLAEVDRILGHVTLPARGEPKADQAVVAVYRTCMNVLAGEAEELPAFRDHLQRIGVSWPSVSPKPDIVLAAVRVYAHFGVTAVLRVRRLVITGASDMLEVAPDEGFLGEWKKTRDRLLSHGVYKQLFEETISIYSSSNSSPAQEVLRYDQFVEIESNVLVSLAARKLPGNVTFVRSVNSLATVTKNIEKATWLAAAQTLKLSSVAQVHMIDLDYVKRVDEVLNTVGAQRFHYYLGWCVVQLMRRYIDKDLARSWYDYEGSTATLYESGRQRSQADCVQLLESLVGPLTFRRFMLWGGDSSHADLSSMRATIMGQLRKKLTRAQVYGKVDRYFYASDFGVHSSDDTLTALDRALGPAWELSNSSSLLSNWMYVATTVSTINATFRNLISTANVRDLVVKEHYSLFDERKGTVSLLPMYAMLPVYSQHLSDAAKFGALGTLIATASFRVFLARLTANSSAHDKALQKLSCFTDAADYHSDRLDHYHLAASVEVALESLRLLHKPDRLRLQMFSNVQTFFVLMCYLLCTPHTSENAEYAHVTCNEAARNDAEFPGAFECPYGSPMNPARKCRFF